MSLHQDVRCTELLQQMAPVFRAIAKFYGRRSWGLPVLQREDYLQEAYIAALDVYGRHKDLSRYRVRQLMRKAAVFRLHRLWRKELAHHILHVDLADITAEDGYVFERLYFEELLIHAKSLLSDLQREMLDVLLRPQTDDLTWLFCSELFVHRQWQPVQRGEYFYLSQYFQLPIKTVERLVADIRAILVPELGFA